MNSLSDSPGCAQRCPGCSHKKQSLSESGRLKERFLLQSFASLESLDKNQLLPRTSGNLRGYREKSTLHARRGSEGWRLGLLLKSRNLGRTIEELIPIPDCPVHSDRLNRVFERVARSFPIGAPLVFVSISGELLTLVLKSKPIEVGVFREWLNGSSILPDFGSLGIKGVYLNFNASAGRRVFSSRGWRHLGGSSEGRFSLGAQELSYGPASFQQAIPDLYKAALGEAGNFLEKGESPLVFDLYSGIGASLLEWKNRGLKSIGVELSGESARCASENSGFTVFQGRCGERLPQLRAELVSFLSCSVFANPPRTGLEPALLNWICEEGKIKRFAYLSCSPGTLTRDLRLLVKEGWILEKVIPFDFFPGTQHVECLVLATRVSR